MSGRGTTLSWWLMACALAAASPAFAQGKPPTVPPGQTKRVQQVPSTSGLVSPESIDLPANGRVRTFGAWLDDASALAPGEAWLALSMSKWDMPIATGKDAPVIDLSVGVAPRVQVSATVPYFRVTDRFGASFRGLGDLYLGSKVVLRHATSPDGFGVSVGPTLELLSNTSTAGTGLERVNWLLPINIEQRFSTGRIYGSTGYFTRGVFFASGAYERPLTDRLVLSGALSHAYATDPEAISEEIGLRRQRLDLSSTVAYSVSPALAVFGSLGRTVWGFDEDSTRMLGSVGVSVNLARPAAPVR
jgi:hypothetical protein